jgi:hypothetical protein
MSDQDQQRREAARTQTESRAAATGHEYGIQAQAQKINERKQNPQFYDRFTKSSIEDSDRWEGLADDFAVWLADDHVLSNRREVYRQQREILNKVRAEQAVVGGTPGVRLREKPLLNALAQGVTVELDDAVSLDASGQQSVEITDPQFSPPMTSEHRTGMDDLASVATARQAMGVEQAGSEALTTATTESRTVREEETDESGLVGSVSGVFD